MYVCMYKRLLVHVEKKFPQANVVNEMRIHCNDCGTTVLSNRIYYEDYFAKSKPNLLYDNYYPNQ